MIETLIGALGLRVGRFTSPHLESMTERISLDGEPMSEEAFVAAFNDVAPYTHLVDAEHDHPLSFFETVVAMAYAAFADAPVDAAVVEVGMGGRWDATNVIDAKVAVLTPIAVDHAKYLGDTPRPDRPGEGRHHQARRHRGHRRPARGRSVVAPRSAAPRSAPPWPARDSSSASPAGCPPSVASCSACRACAAPTTTSSCRSTAPTRRRTPRSRWRRSRPSSAGTTRWTPTSSRRPSPR